MSRRPNPRRNVRGLLAGLFALVAYVATAQESSDPTLPNSQVRVTKLFDARLADAERVATTPSLPELDTATVAQRYAVVPVDAEFAYEPPKIRPLAIKAGPPGPSYKGYARAGAGLPNSWLGDVGYATRNEQLALRADLHTYGAGVGRDSTRPVFTEVEGRLGGTYYTPGQLATDLDLAYERRGYRFYGFEALRADTTERLPPDQRDQSFSVFGVGLGVRNYEPTASGIDYYARARADFLADAFATKERNVRLLLGGRRDFGERWYAEAEVDIDLTSFEAFASQSLHNYAFTPVVGANFEAVGLRGGVAVTSSDDVFRFFPLAEITYALGGGFVAVAGVDGGLRKNTFTRLTRYLPYLVEDPELRNSEEWRGYARLEGRTRGVSYQVSAGYARVNNLALFGQDDSLAYRFRPRYDTAAIVNVGLAAQRDFGDRLGGAVTLDQRFISPSLAAEPYLLPSLDLRVSGNYELIDDVLPVEVSVTVQNGLPYLDARSDPPGALARTELLLDLSANSTYWFSEHLGAFAQLNNLLNNRREQFPGYPSVGINVLVGVTGRF